LPAEQEKGNRIQVYSPEPTLLSDGTLREIDI
jgi:hypothetical protein